MEPATSGARSLLGAPRGCLSGGLLVEDLLAPVAVSRISFVAVVAAVVVVAVTVS